MAPCFDAFGMLYTGPLFCSCTVLWDLSGSYYVFLQTTELQKDRVKVASAMIKSFLANPDKETAKLIRAAQEDYESEYVSCTQVWNT